MTRSNTLYSTRDPRATSSTLRLSPLVGGSLTLDFINTSATDGNRPADDAFAPGFANVIAWYQHAGLLDEEISARLLRNGQREPRIAAAVRQRVVALREALREIVIAIIDGIEPNPTALSVLTAEGRDTANHGAFAVDDGSLTWVAESKTDPSLAVWLMTREAIHFLEQIDVSRGRQCAGDGCTRLFLDTSKNGSRRFCSPATCGGTARVRRFRERERTDRDLDTATSSPDPNLEQRPIPV